MSEQPEYPPYSMILEWDPCDQIFVVSVPELLVHYRSSVTLSLDEAVARRTVNAAAEVIVYAAPVIIDALNAKRPKQPLVEMLPDQHVTAGGGVSE